MRIERQLDPQAVDKAEKARTTEGVVAAAKKATEALGELTPERVNKFVQNEEQLAVLACLARIQVDSLKSIATKAGTPGRTLAPLEIAAHTIEVVYRNPVVVEALQGVVKDHQERDHDFLGEMPRDIAKTVFAASPLYDNRKAQELLVAGERLLQETYDKLPDTHPTKPLIGIELQLARVARGMPLASKTRLLRDFKMIEQHDKKENPHRFMTVASWLSIWGEHLHDPKIKEVGMKAYNEMVEAHPQWRYMVGDERLRLDAKQWKATAFGLLTPVTSAERRDALYTSLLSHWHVPL